MYFRYSVLMVVFCCMIAQAASGQGATMYNTDGIKFNYPPDAVTEDQGSKGSFSAATCVAADGSYFSVCVFRDKTTVEEAIKQNREKLQKDFTVMKAGEIRFIDIQEPLLSTPANGFQLNFRLNRVSFENRTLCALFQDKVICITRQFVSNKKSSAETFFQQILSTLKIQ